MNDGRKGRGVSRHGSFGSLCATPKSTSAAAEAGSSDWFWPVGAVHLDQHDRQQRAQSRQRRSTNEWQRCRGQQTLSLTPARHTGASKVRPSVSWGFGDLLRRTTARKRHHRLDPVGLATSCAVPPVVEQVCRPGGSNQAREGPRSPRHGTAPDSSTSPADEARLRQERL
jgi:hypothetical protein